MLSGKRILVLSHVLPWPLDSGAKVRAYYVLRHLAQRHRVTLLSLTRPADPPDAVRHLAEFCESVETVAIRRSFVRDVLAVLSGFVFGRAALVQRERSPQFQRVLSGLLTENRFDALHVDQLKTAVQLEHLRALPPRLIDKHNVYHEMVAALAGLEARGWRRALLEREANKLKAFEARVCREFTEVVAVTERDAKRLAELAGTARRVTTIPICIAPDRYPAVGEPATDTSDVFFVGPMNYPPNVDGALWFIREVLPHVWLREADVRFHVVGRSPSADLRRIAESDRRIRLHGYEETLDRQLSAALAAVVPVRVASGMRVKILDAMARRLPIVSTPVGAEGIDARSERDILIADTPEEFALAVVRLVRDSDLRARLATNGRQLVEDRYDWRRRYAAFDDVYERLCGSGGHAS